MVWQNILRMFISTLVICSKLPLSCCIVLYSANLLNHENDCLLEWSCFVFCYLLLRLIISFVCIIYYILVINFFALFVDMSLLGDFNFNFKLQF